MPRASRALSRAAAEHWYRVFPPSQVAVLCTEELEASGAAAVARAAEFVGLVPFDFAAAVAQGKFNAAELRG